MKNMIIGGLVLLTSQGCAAQPLPPPQSVYMYTNGYTWIVRSGTVNTPQGVFKITDKDIPQAIAGTLWFNSPAGISHVQQYRDTQITKVPAASNMQLLRANIGKEVTIRHTYPGKDPLVYSGKIEQVTFDSTSSDLYNEGMVVLSTPTGKVALFRTTLNYSSIELGNDAILQTGKSRVTNRLDVHFKGNPSSARLDIASLVKQAAWEPMYRLRLNGETAGDLTLSAEISSPGFAMNNGNLNLVLAAPDVAQGSRLSRLTGSNDWYSYAPATDDAMPYPEGKYQVRVGFVSDETADVGVENGKSDDYYIYRLSNVNIRRDANMQVQLLQGEIKLNHVYQSTLPDATEYAAPAPADPATPVYYTVYHKIRAVNSMKQPWAAAPVLIENPDQGSSNMVSQVQMPFTPAGETAYITLNTSSDLPLQHNEEETGRVTGALSVPVKYSGYTAVYDKVSVKATITVTNRGDKAARLVLNRQITGKTLSSDATWTVKTLKSLPGSPNGRNAVEWELNLKPGESRTFTYTYETLIKTN